MNIISIEDNKNNQIKKHNDIIKAKGNLSSTAQKMLSMLISMIRVDDSEFQEYALNIKEYSTSIKSDSSNVDFLKNQALELMKNPFYVINEKGKKDFFNWCSKVSPYTLNGYIIFKIDSDLKPYLLDLQKHFTTYNIVNVLSLRGDYSPRLYEYLVMEWKEFKRNYKKRHNKTPKNYTIELEIDWLREHLGISDGYRYNNIKTQIIKVAQKQFKEKTDIQFDYEEQKIGRKVNSLKITIRDNNKGSNDYLATIQSFTAYIRDKYKPDITNDIFPTVVETKNGNIKIDAKGRLYLSGLGKVVDYDNKQSQKLWEQLYQIAQDGREF